jgi:hypothetical protein
MIRSFLAPAAALALLAGCGGAEGAGEKREGAGLATTIDSTGDTVFARVAGEVPAAAVRSLVVELAIAPGADDTTLFTDVSEFDVDRRGRFWVYDNPGNAVYLFDAEGHLVRRVGRQGGGPGEFNANGGMVALGDTGFAVLDPRNARISFFDSAGGYRTSWRTPSGFFTSNGLVTDRSGVLYLRRPVSVSREGEILGRMGLVRAMGDGVLADSLAPPDLEVQREVYLAVSKDGNSRSSTSSRYAPQYYWGWHPDGYFVVADGGRGHIILARSGARPVAIRREVGKVAVDPDEREEERAQLQWNMRQTDPAWSWSGPPLPGEKAPLMGLFLARDGRIWVRVATASERIPEAEVVQPRDPKQTPTRYRTPNLYEVFAPSGRFLGQIRFPPRSRLMEADGDRVWATGRDENDLPAVLRLRIDPALAGGN